MGVIMTEKVSQEGGNIKGPHVIVWVKLAQILLWHLNYVNSLSLYYTDIYLFYNKPSW